MHASASVYMYVDACESENATMHIIRTIQSLEIKLKLRDWMISYH